MHASALIVALAVAVLWIQSGDALKCYSCSKNFWDKDDCANSTKPEDQTNCSSTYCTTTLVVGGTAYRGCGDTAEENKCWTLGALYTCKWSCTTDLCNFQPKPDGASSLSAPTLAALLAVALGLMGLRASA